MKLTKEQISELSDVELNRAMLDAYNSGWRDNINFAIDVANNDTNYLKDYNLLMPLMFEHSVDVLQSFDGRIVACAISHYTYEEEPLYRFIVINKNPSRAICEVLLQIAMESKK